MADAPKPAPKLTVAEQEALDNARDAAARKKEGKAYKDSIVYPETEDVVTKKAPVTGPIGRYATDRLFGRDVPFIERAKGAAVLVPAAAAIQAERGIRYLRRKISGDKEEGKKRGGSIKKYASGGSIRGGGCESRGKTKGRMV
jgi:hypothetical protein